MVFFCTCFLLLTLHKVESYNGYVNNYIVTLFEPKGNRNRENKSDLNEGIMLCLLNTI